MTEVPNRQAQGGSGVGSILASALVAAIVSVVITVPAVRAVDPENGPAAGEQSPTAAPEQVADEPGDDRATTDAPDVEVPESVWPVDRIAEAVLPSVARVDVPGGSGSAVIFRADGYLLTNNHVIERAPDQVQVTLASGERLAAEVVGAAAFTDLAVLRIDADDLPVPAFAQDIPDVGSLAIAIGSPFGLDATVTAGVVSALNRTLAAGPQTVLGDLVQTDAAINPGNSGGALVNGNAEVIGINTAIVSPSRASAGIGFAIPVTTAIPIAEQLIEEGTVTPAFLGIAGGTVDPQVAELYNLGVESGAVVQEVVPGSPADEAGLQQGDIITALDGEPIESMVRLSAEIKLRRPGDQVRLTYVRDGEEVTTEVTLGQTPEDAPSP